MLTVRTLLTTAQHRRLLSAAVKSARSIKTVPILLCVAAHRPAIRAGISADFGRDNQACS